MPCNFFGPLSSSTAPFMFHFVIWTLFGCTCLISDATHYGHTPPVRSPRAKRYDPSATNTISCSWEKPLVGLGVFRQCSAGKPLSQSQSGLRSQQRVRCRSIVLWCVMRRLRLSLPIQFKFTKFVGTIAMKFTAPPPWVIHSLTLASLRAKRRLEGSFYSFRFAWLNISLIPLRRVLGRSAQQTHTVNLNKYVRAMKCAYKIMPLIFFFFVASSVSIPVGLSVDTAYTAARDFWIQIRFEAASFRWQR